MAAEKKDFNREVAICEYFNQSRGCKRGNNCKYRHISTQKLVTHNLEEIPICEFFQQSRGCKRGATCKFRHVIKQHISNNNHQQNGHRQAPICEYFNRNGGCKKGTNCRFRHEAKQQQHQQMEVKNNNDQEAQCIIIRKRDFDNNNAQRLVESVVCKMNIVKLPFFVFDIHNTTEYTNLKTNKQHLDMNVLQYIRKLTQNGYSVIFLSYDGDEKRIETNRNFLNTASTNLYLKINKIFVKKREKGMILYYIEQYIKRNVKIKEKENMYKVNIVFVDDNYSNIENASNYFKIPDELIVFNYSKHSKWNDDNNDFSQMYNLFDIQSKV